ncbi:hypothetical protein DW657_05455 [Prevotella sp. AM23-5]|nr:hypothetical protein DW657_05455 [Prevotella sp. AM23-5]
MKFKFFHTVNCLLIIGLLLNDFGYKDNEKFAKTRDLLQKSTQNNVKSLCANTFIKKYALLLRSKRAYA